MSSEYTNTQPEMVVNDLELYADAAIRHGKFEDAKKWLDQGIDAAYGGAESKLKLTPLMLKRLALPFYKIHHYSQANEDVSYKEVEDIAEEAEIIHSWAGELLDYTVADFASLRRAGNNTPALQEAVGSISEVTFFTLMAREYNEHGRIIPLPTAVRVDKAGAAGADFLIAAGGQPELPLVRSQIKARLKPEHYRYYQDDIILLGLNELLEDSKAPFRIEEHPLIGALTRELQGISPATAEQMAQDEAAIERAQHYLYKKLPKAFEPMDNRSAA